MLRAKLDTLANIDFYKSMVKHLRDNVPEDEWDDWIEALSGLVGYYYKAIGGTQIPFDETLFALPAWLPFQADEAQLAAASRLLASHRELIWALRGKPPKYALTADELVILNDYRRFITMGEPDSWIDFAID
jgi:hypothetical protein